MIEMTTFYRELGASDDPPYIYTNGLGLKASDYDTAIKQNAERLGVSVYETQKYVGRNYLNSNYYQQDGSHYNAHGFALLAKILDALDRSFID
jgi:hypothetical protein